jgi:hypothetical protein
MIRNFIILCSAIIVLCTQAQAGYSVIVRAQVSPKTILVQGVGKMEAALNPGPAPVYPATAGKKICSAVDIYSADPLQRSEVWEDSAGTAGSQELFAACPQIRQQKEAEIRAEGDRRLKGLAQPYMDGERETWGVQMAEARACLDDSEACTDGPGKNPESFVPMIAQMAKERGITILALTGKIWENVTLFRQASGQILGAQQRLLDQIDAATDFAALLAITW